jgi:effector-binding domain-containing protein
MTATTHEIITLTMGEQHTAVVRATMPAAHLDGWLAGAFEAVDDYLARADLAPAGPAFARYACCDGEVAVEAGYPVSGEITGNAWVQASMLPGGPAAAIAHRGSQVDLERADIALRGWLEASGHQPAGPHWEVFHTDPLAEREPAQWRTDLVVPFRPDREPGGDPVTH